MGTVSRVVNLLRLVALSSSPVAVSDLAEELRLPVSTVHRLIQLLRREGMVEPDDASRRYRPGAELRRIARVMANRGGVVERAQPVLSGIVAMCNETAQLALYLPAERRMAFFAQVDCTHPLRFSIPLEVRQSLVWGSSGRVILAHLPEAEAREIVAAEGPSPVSGEPAPTYDDLAPVLERIRRDGWDVTRSQKLANAVGFSGPVLDGGTVVGSLSIPIPTVRYHERHEGDLQKIILSACAELSRADPHT